MERGNYLAPYRSLKTSVKFKGETTKHKTTFSPPTAKPGDTLYIDFPSVKDELIIPNTLGLSFDLEIVLDPSEPGTEVKTYPVNNLAANIFCDFKVKIGSQYIFELNNAYLYNTYKDLWLTKYERKNRVINGLQDVNLRKLRSDLKTRFVPSVQYMQVQKVYGKRYLIPINFEMITDHMPMSGCLLDSEITFELKINSVKNVLNYANRETANFELNNICLEFETIKDSTLYKEIERDLITGTQFLYDHVHHYRREEIGKDQTFLNVEIKGLDRKSLKGILLLFEDEFEPGQRDSEKFANPFITDIRYTIDGLPNKLYSNGLREADQWPEICKHFILEEFKQSRDINMDLELYHTGNKFALWTDLRSTEDNTLHGTGKLQESKNVIKMEITKTVLTSGKFVMHIFVVSDARIIIKDKKLASFDY